VAGAHRSRGTLDELDNGIWMRHHGYMAGSDFHSRRAHALGEEAFRVGRDGLIVRGDQIPRGLPRGSRQPRRQGRRG